MSELLTMAAAAWQLINVDDGACVVAVFNALSHGYSKFVLLLHEPVLLTIPAVRSVLLQMYWAHDNIGACCGLVCEDGLSAPC